MSNLIAALDLGTNTFHLLIAEANNGNISKIVEEQRHVKLGEGGINAGLITEAAFNRGIEALKSFKAIIDQHHITSIAASGTAALRTAANGGKFIEEVKEATGITIDIINGELEAELIYKGIRAATDLNPSSLIMDIGGGSVEFILCDNSKIFWKKSYPIGAAKLMEAFHHSDPISAENILAIHSHLSSLLTDLERWTAEINPHKLVGSAGAFETFAALETDRHNKDQNLLNSVNYQFETTQLGETLEYLIGSVHSERAGNPLIIPVRTDMIVVASILTRYIIEKLGIRKVNMSRYSLKEGLLIQQARENV